MIYFIECDDAIKIGYTRNPAGRLSALQTSNPGDLFMRLIIEGSPEDEKKHHDMFQEEKIRGEWFYKSNRLSDYIESMQRRDLRYNFGLIPSSDKITNETTRVRNAAHLSLRLAGEKMGITAQSVREIEVREASGSVSLNVMMKYAAAMGYRFMYRFVKCEDDFIEKPKNEEFT